VRHSRKRGSARNLIQKSTARNPHGIASQPTAILTIYAWLL
jgi:hypothetical protein